MMTTARRRAAVIVAVAAAFTAAVAPPGPVLAGEDPLVTIDGTICYEKVKDSSGSRSNRMVVSLSMESKEDVVVVVHSEDGTAQSPDDYQGFERFEIRIPAGKLRVEVPLHIVDDDKKEGDEFFTVVIDEVKGAKPGNDKAEITIRDGAPPKDDKPAR